MKTYGIVSPLFWTGETGTMLRNAGANAQLIALYLVTGPSANMSGIYHLPIPLISHHTGMSAAEIVAAMLAIEQTGFCEWDQKAETVFVPMNAKYQIGEHLKEKDRRKSALIRELRQHKKSRFISKFLCIYGDAYAIIGEFPDAKPCQPAQTAESSKGLVSAALDCSEVKQINADNPQIFQPPDNVNAYVNDLASEGVQGDCKSFDLSDEGLAQEFCFHATAHVGIRKRDNPQGITPMIAALVKTGVLREAIRAEIRRKGRDTNEWFDAFSKRLKTKSESKLTPQQEREQRIAAENALAKRLRDERKAART